MGAWGLRAGLCAVVAAGVLLGGCGDSDEEGGTGGVGAVGGAGGAPAATKVLSLRFVDTTSETERPIGGMMVAADVGDERVEQESGPAGYAYLRVPYRSGESVDWIAAHPDYGVVASVAADLDDPAWDEVVEIRLVAFDAPAATEIPVRVVPQGVPEGGSWCAGLGSWIGGCLSGSQEFNFSLEEWYVQDFVTAIARDENGAVVEFVRAPLEPSGNGRLASVTFDGASDVDPVTKSFTLMLPDDPESPFRTETLDLDWTGWAVSAERGTYLSRGWSHDVDQGVDSLTFDMTEFPTAGGDQLYAMAIYANYSDPVRTFRWLSAELQPGTFEFLDVARITDAELATGPITFTEPEGAERYTLVFDLPNGKTVMTMETPVGGQVQLPAFPSGYDPAEGPSPPGTPGELWVLATQGEMPDETSPVDEPYAVDGQASFSVRRTINF
ncbi:MAG: hypothetical protein JRI23_01805 [Deltaproteobacteria bacterium]|nr:hypothetical protein [Deltaproteobacteria bacterium]MBW2530209.1 hypothetical protein [Deltaproteobacteria bacterium]